MARRVLKGVAIILLSLLIGAALGFALVGGVFWCWWLWG